MNEAVPPKEKGILVAIPDEWRMKLVAYLMSKTLSVIEASTYEKALEIIRSQQLQGIIVVDEWIVSKDGKLTDIKESIPKDTPVLMLVGDRETYDWLNIACESPLQDYRSVPVSGDEIDSFLRRNGLVK